MKIVALALLLLCPIDALADAFNARGKFVYSDFCSGPEPWRFHGHRVEFHVDSSGVWARVDFAEWGGEAGPVSASPVFLDAPTGELIFWYQSTNDEFGFDGAVTPGALTGHFEDTDQTLTLPRVPNSWPDAPPCVAPKQ